LDKSPEKDWHPWGDARWAESETRKKTIKTNSEKKGSMKQVVGMTKGDLPKFKTKRKAL
jgi:hypothetical protein